MPPKLNFDPYVLALVAHYVIALKKRPADIQKLLLNNHQIKIKRHDIYNNILPNIVRLNWLRLETPLANELSEEVRQKAPHLEEAAVTLTSELDDVAKHAAYTIRDLITQTARKKEKICIGFSGGNTIRRAFQELIQALMNPALHGLSEQHTICCHALVAGFDNTAPGTFPSSFFTYLDDSPVFFKKEYVLLQAPAFVPGNERETVLGFPGIREAQERTLNLDLIVTSAAAFADKHSQLKQYYESQPGTSNDLKRLQDAECVGDMLWLPIGPHGPVDMSNFDHRPVALLELKDLPARIAGKHETKVLLVIGPCAHPSEPCVESKAPVLEAILNLPERYVTHLVADRRTASEFLKM